MQSYSVAFKQRTFSTSSTGTYRKGIELGPPQGPPAGIRPAPGPPGPGRVPGIPKGPREAPGAPPPWAQAPAQGSLGPPEGNPKVYREFSRPPLRG